MRTKWKETYLLILAELTLLGYTSRHMPSLSKQFMCVAPRGNLD
jgi:hypothetical protein